MASPSTSTRASVRCDAGRPNSGLCCVNSPAADVLLHAASSSRPSSRREVLDRTALTVNVRAGRADDVTVSELFWAAAGETTPTVRMLRVMVTRRTTLDIGSPHAL